MGGGLRHVPLILFNSLCHLKKKLPYFPHPECRSVSANGVPFVFFCIPLFFGKKKTKPQSEATWTRPAGGQLSLLPSRGEGVRCSLSSGDVRLFLSSFLRCFLLFRLVLLPSSSFSSFFDSTPPHPRPATPPFLHTADLRYTKKKTKKKRKKRTNFILLPNFPPPAVPPPRPTTWTSVGKLEEVFFLPFGNRPMGSSVATDKLGRF